MNFTDFMRASLKGINGFQVARHHEVIAEHLDRLDHREFQGLLVMLPPSMGASTLARLYASWKLQAALSFALDRRYEEITLGSNGLDRSRPGSYIQLAPHSLPVLADFGLVDFRFDFLVCDTDEQCPNYYSKKMRRDIGDYIKTLTSKHFRCGGIAAWFTRAIFPDGPARKIIDENLYHGLQMNKQWKVIEFPAIIEDEYDIARDPIGRRKIGEVLWPEKFSKERLADIKEKLGQAMFNAAFQQKIEAGVPS
jgi:hypothetical protein